MSQSSPIITIWQRLSALPLGKWLFSRLVCFKAPYFSSIRPRFVDLRAGYSEVIMRKRRSVTNHIGTVHAVAMCNMAELAAGTMTDVSIPRDCRWIPKGMTVRYLAKATSDLRAIAELPRLPELREATELSVPVRILDSSERAVFEAEITMWVTPRSQR